MNNKMSGDLKKIQVTGKYFVEIWKAIGMESIDDKVCCLGHCQSFQTKHVPQSQENKVQLPAVSLSGTLLHVGNLFCRCSS